MPTIGAGVSQEYYNKVFDIADKRGETIQQVVLDAVDRYLILLNEMKIKRIFKPKIKMEDKWEK